jgi:hypothetical protein
MRDARAASFIGASVSEYREIEAGNPIRQRIITSESSKSSAGPRRG